MATATVTSKGQITIPVRVREALGLDAGDRVEFVEFEKGQFAIIPATRSVREPLATPPRPASMTIRLSWPRTEPVCRPERSRRAQSARASMIV